jgi:NO-binding membrane sensor protein with MHYT domain
MLSVPIKATDNHPVTVSTHKQIMNETTHDITIKANGLLVTLSYIISALGVFTAFQIIAEAKFVAHKLVKGVFILCASVSVSMRYVKTTTRLFYFFFKSGVWSMHFIGTICFSHYYVGDQLTIRYDLVALIFSGITPLVVIFIGFFVCALQLFASEHCNKMCETSRKCTRRFQSPMAKFLVRSIIGDDKRPHIIQVLIGGLICASGVCAMHYIGMQSTIINFTVRSYNPLIVFASVVIAIAACCVALWLSFNLDRIWLQLVFSLVAGVATCGMHYTGMMSANYIYTPVESTGSSGSITLSNFEVTIVVAILAMVSCLVLLLLSSYAKYQRQNLERANVQLEKELHLIESTNQLSKIANNMHATQKLTKIIANSVRDCVIVVNSTLQIIHANSNFKFMFDCEYDLVQDYMLNKFIEITPLMEKELCNVESTVTSFSTYLAQMQYGKQVPIQVTRCFDMDKQDVVLVLQLEYVDRSEAKTRFPSKAKLNINQISVKELAIDELLFNNATSDSFAEFCKKKLLFENVQFLLQVQHYKTLKLVEERVKMQHQIFEEFINMSASKALNLDNSTIAIERANISNIQLGDIHVFDNIETMIKGLLYDNVYTAYKKSTM